MKVHPGRIGFSFYSLNSHRWALLFSPCFYTCKVFFSLKPDFPFTIIDTNIILIPFNLFYTLIPFSIPLPHIVKVIKNI
ncbi:hypothetical protein BX661DRAFT_6196 [Kickxella alabastrina]|uniref:uncharacterized protein n=1 Tax=Kickxella alabastrina TaxID=61397 RepID=UPI00221FD55C|nr:uncharacterized protein BX661DRAFT_6196 [Kickxella alabastrina]KAI7834895.1 hypothetical protein BX661DRAFT_6196 [Kickxella alabastrina]